MLYQQQQKHHNGYSKNRVAAPLVIDKHLIEFIQIDDQYDEERK